ADKSALGADWNDDCVLDDLSLDESKNFRTKILVTIRPANTAARDRSAAQMHGLETVAVNENLAVWSRLVQIGDGRAVDLQDKRFWRVPVLILVEIIRAQGFADNRQYAAQHAIFVQFFNLVHQMVDLDQQSIDIQ